MNDSFAIALERIGECLWGRREKVRERETIDQRFDVAPICGQNRVRRSTRGGDRDVGRDVRVPVPIASDPGAEFYRNELVQLLAELFDECAQGLLPNSRSGIDQAILEIPERVAHLVHHRGPIALNLSGEPEELDLRLELLDDLTPAPFRCSFVGEQQVRDPCLKRQERATRRLGRMGRQHRSHIQRTHRLRDLLRGSPLRPQPVHHPS